MLCGNESFLLQVEMTTSLAPTSPEFCKLKDLAQQLVTHKQWDAALVVSLGGSLAAEANRLVNLSGSQKKQLVLDVVKAVLNESVKASTAESAERLKQLVFVVEGVLPASLDLAVAAARGKFDLKKTKRTCFAAFVACLPSLVSAVGGSKQHADLVVRSVESVAEKIDPEFDLDGSLQKKPDGSFEHSNPLAEIQKETPENKETPPPQTNPEVVLEPREGVAIPPTESQTA
jgi:hypothetical protein